MLLFDYAIRCFGCIISCVIFSWNYITLRNRTTTLSITDGVDNMSSKTTKQPTVTQEEKDRKAAEKAKRKAEFEAKRSAELKSKETSKKASDVGDANTSKADLRKQRREQQEAQRAAKAKEQEKKDVVQETKDGQSSKVLQSKENIEPKPILKSILKDPSKKTLINTRTRQEEHMQVFPEIPSRHPDINSLTRDLGFKGEVYHPEIVRLGVKTNQGVIKGSSPRLLSLMVALKQLIQDYSTPSGKVLDRDLPASIDKSMDFLAKCRPLTTGMMNGAAFVKRNITRLTMEGSQCEKTVTDQQLKEQMVKIIDNYIEDEICCALKSIVEEGAQLISEKDVIMTLGCSLKVQHVLYRAIQSGKKFTVVVVDSGPDYDGVNMLKFLQGISTKDQISLKYIYISAIAHVMKSISKVIVGGHGVLANGYVMSKMGASQIALVSNSYNVPFIVCCETNEFSDAVHTDAFVYNESGLCRDYFKVKNEKLGKVIKDCCGDAVDSQTQGKKRKNLKLLNLLFDVTPPDFVSMIVTEMGIIPCTAVSAVIRRNFSKLQ